MSEHPTANQQVANDGSIVDLSQRDLELCCAMAKWIETARKSGGLGYGPGWLPSYPDILKSRLFWRIRSGKDPLPHPPPRAYSCPWYEVVEEYETPHDGFETLRAPFGWKGIVVAQCIYDEIGREGEKYILGFGPYRFRAWNGVREITWRDGTRNLPCSFIQRAIDLEQKP